MGSTGEISEQREDSDGGARVEVAASFVSYAQNYEDLRLWYALQDVDAGTYVDVGAHDPDSETVTRAFYERGWSGINIEPLAACHEKLVLARPRDVNLRVAVGASAGESVFFEVGDSALSTLRATVAERHIAAGYRVDRTRVDVRMLRDIWTEHVRGEVHFLKVDVEGAEGEVLAGADLQRQRPWIIVVEATVPNTGIPTHHEWEPVLTAAGYRFAVSDDLNRYYVADERSELARALKCAPIGPEFGRSRPAELAALLLEGAGGERFDPGRSPFLGLDQPTPTLHSPTSQLCTESQVREPEYRACCNALRQPPTLHCKQWEDVYILRVLAVHGLLKPGRRGLGFGAACEPLTAAVASRGCAIVATHPARAAVGGPGSPESGQHPGALEKLEALGICEPHLLQDGVSFRTEDINRISPDLRDFDFVWSCSALEHLGSIRRCLEFVVQAMRCLKPGGVAVHTTAFNLTSNYRTIEAPEFVALRRYDVDALMSALRQAGHPVAQPNLNPGSGVVDRHVDAPPYRSEPHLRWRMDRYVLTSIGLIVERGA